MELHDVKNWAYDKLDNSIIFTKKEIMKLESQLKMLREVKSQKMMTDSLAMITDFGIDFSLADLQAFLTSRRNVVAKTPEETPEEKSKKAAEAEISEPEISSDTQTTDFLPENVTAVEEDAEVTQPKSEREKVLQTIAEKMGLPKDSSLADVRLAFKRNKNLLPPAWNNNFGELLEKMERGDFV